MNQNWEIIATFPGLLQPKRLGLYNRRNEAESDAGKYRRFLGGATVAVYWNGVKHGQ